MTQLIEFPAFGLWLVFVILGLLMVLLELLAGVETGYDLLIIGSAFIFGGLVTWPFHSWLLTVVVTGVICAAYVALGRRYIHRPSLAAKTNVDSIIGRKGIVLQSIAKNVDGLIKVGNEEWRARSETEEDIKNGEEITVSGISGVTLIVRKTKGGN